MKTIFLVILVIGTSYAEPQLQLINVVFRHGDRAPVVNSIFPTDPNFNSSFHPFGHGGLTNDGKYRVYKLGKFLRQRYKDFLGDVYSPNMFYARTADLDRTKICLQIVLTALFPPSKKRKWHNNRNWQPIPYTYVPRSLDDVLAVASQTSFVEEKRRVSKSEFIQNRFKQWKPFISELEKLTNTTIKQSFDIIKIYDTLYCEWKMNLPLPSWTKGIFPNGKLLDAALTDYEVMMYDNKMIYQLVGKLTEKIRGDILAATRTNETATTKLFLYSAHELNVAGTLRSLQVYHEHHIPNFASAVIIELLKDNDKYYVKVLYYDGESTEVEEMKLPGCSLICPLEKYLAVVNELLD